MQEKIYYRKVRDLTAVFSATFGFIRQNFGNFFGGLLLFSGPFLLIYGTVSSMTFNSLFSLTRLAYAQPSAYLNLAAAYSLAVIALLVGNSVFNVTINRYIIQNENLPAGQRPGISSLANGFFSDYWRLLANMALFFVVMIISVVVLVFLFAGIFALIGFGGAGNTALMVMLILALVAAMFIFGPVLVFVPITALFVCQRDGVPIFAAIGKVFYYMKANFWNTWAVSFLALLTYSMMSMLAQLPVLIMTMLSTFSRLKETSAVGHDDASLTLVIVTTICTLLSFGVMSIYHLMSIYHYTSLEEKKEGTSVLEKINQVI